MPKSKFDLQGDLRAWSEALAACADLQQELETASANMTMLDDWDWQDSYRELVTNVWKMLTTTPWQERRKVAEDYRDQAQRGVVAVRALTEAKAYIGQRKRASENDAEHQ